MSLVVEVSVFSGRDNPRFVLGADDEAELRRLLARCWHPTDAEPTRPGLGYRGLVVYRRTADGSWQPWFTVADGVAVRATDGTRHTTPAVEALLLQAAGRAGLDRLIEHDAPHTTL